MNESFLATAPVYFLPRAKSSRSSRWAFLFLRLMSSSPVPAPRYLPRMERNLGLRIAPTREAPSCSSCAKTVGSLPAAARFTFAYEYRDAADDLELSLRGKSAISLAARFSRREACLPVLR